MKRNKVGLSVIVGVLLAIFLAGVIVGYAPAASHPMPPLPTPPALCNPVGNNMQPGTLREFSADRQYVEDVVIVTGRKTEMDLVVQRVLGQFGQPVLLGEVGFSYLARESLSVNLAQLDNTVGLRQLVNGQNLATTYNQVATRLYSANGRPVWDIVRQIYQEAKTQNVHVVADPDYVLSLAPLALATGNPWGVEGSPWGVEGSPAGGGAPTPAEAEAFFWEQWAFSRTYGLGLLTADHRRTVDWTGRGVRVGVFDTSPLNPAGSHTIIRNTINFNLCVSLPQPVVQLPIDTKHTSVNEHGLFVSGLVYAVAPESSIHLIRVLNANAEGDLFTLINGLQLFTERALTDNAISPTTRGLLTNTVLNLSLGFRPEASLPASMVDELRSLTDTLPTPYYREASEILPVPSLKSQLLVAAGLNAVIVAAAGNDSADYTPPLTMQLPAAWGRVIGVEASNKGEAMGGHACYSNLGEIRAPGGNGGPSVDAPPEPCVPHLEECPRLGPGCGFGVISFVTINRASAPNGVAYWVGTSFAAPLVSGVSALALQRGVAAADVFSDLRSRINSTNGSIMVGP